MKFTHIADAHFDMPFTALAKNNLSEERRLQIRSAFSKMIDFIKKEEIEYLFISGDLYENEYVRKSTIEFINNCFKEIPNTQIYIAPGNHDPFLINSYYSRYKWNDNVHIFTKLEKIEKENINIYGYGFTEFYSDTINLPSELEESKINILVMHADLNGAKNEFIKYNPILESSLKEKNFNYVALGHIHKNNLDEDKNIVYPGSLISGGFDELGNHGMIYGVIDEITKETKLEFITLDDYTFKEYSLDISNIKSTEELIEKINSLELEENCYYKIILTGNRFIQINKNEIMKYINKPNIIKVKDETTKEYDLDKISKEQSLRGIFVKELLKEINESNKEEILNSIYMGLDLM